MINYIYTNRHFQSWPSWQIVYEWEDILAERLDIPVKESPCNKNFGYKILNKISKSITEFDYSGIIQNLKFTDKYFLCFEMSPKKQFSFSNHRNSVPIIIDFWKNYDIKTFIKYYKKCSTVFISSLEVLNYLKINKCTLNLKYFPLSLPDIYKLEPEKVFEKQYDVVIPGRANIVLWEYLKLFEKKYPEIKYAYQKNQNGKLYYVNNNNETIGNFQSRESYFKLLKLAKVCFYSTPGIDGGEKRTGGFNPITPRFLESLAAGCHVIARYVENEDSEFYQLHNICSPVNSYKEFEKQLIEAIYETESPVKRNASYLKNHYTSSRISYLEI